MNLLFDNWLSVRDVNDKVKLISPCDVTDTSLIEICAQREDFTGAQLQFLIGLFQTEYMPINEKEWFVKLKNPPTREELITLFNVNAIKNSFNVDISDIRFMQDLSAVDNVPIYQLLIGAPKNITIDRNRDFFIKRDDISCLCPSCAVSAMIAFQLYGAPVGPHHYYSLRGGRPLTTLIIGKNLWETIWLNILSGSSRKFKYINEQNELPLISDENTYPWVNTSKYIDMGKKSLLAENDVNSVHMFWSMSGRMKLNFEENKNLETCDVCGKVYNKKIKTYNRSSTGIHYSSELWYHSLTPYREIEDKDTKNIKIIPIGADINNVLYSHWGNIIYIKDNNIIPAQVISRYINNDLPLPNLRIWAFGVNFDKAKSISWVSHTIPILHVDNKIKKDYINHIITTIEVINYMNKCLYMAIYKIKKSSSSLKNKLYDSNTLYLLTENEFIAYCNHILHYMQNNNNDAVQNTTKNIIHLIQKNILQICDDFVDYNNTKNLLYMSKRNKFSQLMQYRNDLRFFIHSKKEVYEKLNIGEEND